MTSSEKLGRPFERLVAAVQKKLDPGAQVHSPLAVIGRSGSRISLDAAVQGKIGSARLLIAIEAKDYAGKVGVEKVRAFATVLDDIQANHGIMVSPLGFAHDALLTATSFGIETCVLRRGDQRDWEGFNGGVEATITAMVTRYRDAAVVLADGRVIPVHDGGMHLMTGHDGTTKFFDYCVNSYVAEHPDARGTPLRLRPITPLWEENDDGELTAVTELRCTPELVPGLTQTWIEVAPEDCIFAKVTPDGELDESAFLVLSELEQLAEQFRKNIGSE